MNMKNARTLVSILALCAALGACKNVKQELGVGRSSPDEFLVVKRAPLTLPPDYTLRAPEDGTLAPSSEVTAQTRATLLGTPNIGTTPMDSGENALLSKMGAEGADPTIRSTINRENGYLAIESQTLADKLLFWKDPTEDPEKVPSSEVNAKKEAERLKQNQADGKAVNEGDTPTVKKNTGTIDKIF